jgi:hypothetical protein
LLALVACLFVVQAVYAQDTEPPNVLSFDFDPKAVDTSASSQEITFTARLTDDLSGVGMNDDLSWRWSGASFQSPSRNQYASVSFNPNDRVSGTDLDGTYQSKMVLPRYSEIGTWELEYVSISDRVGNTKHLDKGDMVALGFPTEFEVESAGDIIVIRINLYNASCLIKIAQSNILHNFCI